MTRQGPSQHHRPAQMPWASVPVYDQAGALPASQTGTDAQGELEKENNKVFDVFDGTIELAVSQVNAELGEIGGVFVSSQASDTDLGSKVPKKVLSKGIWYAQVEKL